jgi:hypothetical protein
MSPTIPECDELKDNLTRLEKDLAYYEKQLAKAISLFDRDRWQTAINVATDEIRGVLERMNTLGCEVISPSPPAASPRTIATPWAILLCKFNDNASEPIPRSHYERLFTSAGAGSPNMPTFFHENSHGVLDLSGTRVFGWFTIDKKRSEYTGSGPDWPGRQQLVDWGRQAATDAGVDLTPFFAVVVSMNVSTDLFGGGGPQAVCDVDTLQPSLLGQEMGHAYGLMHSHADGSTDEYADLWDVMSTRAAFMQANAEYGEIGPGLNAWNMRAVGWLDESRVWKGAGAYDVTLELRPLHRRDLRGVLAIDVDGRYLVELRAKEGWDGAIPEPVVLVHRFADGHSVLMRGTSGRQGLKAGDVFRAPGSASYTKIEVVSIDASGHGATVRLEHLPTDAFVPGPGGTGPFAAAGIEAGGLVLPGGSTVAVPAGSPVMPILEQLATFVASPRTTQPWARDAIRREALERIRRQLWALDASLNPFHVPAPLRHNQNEDGQ